MTSLSLSIGSCALSCLLQESQGLRSTPHYPSQGYIAGWAQGPLSPMNPQSNLRLLSAHLAFPSTPHPCSLAMPTKHGAALTKVTTSLLMVTLGPFTAADVAGPPLWSGEAQPCSSPPPTPKQPWLPSSALAPSPSLQCRPSTRCTLSPPFSPCTRSDSFCGCNGPPGRPFPS